MDVRWLGWAGVEIEADGASVVIDPLADTAAVFAPLGEAGAGGEVPTVVEPALPGRAVAGLVTHLHRDHADAGALAAALAPGAPVLHPHEGGGAGLEELALVQAERELAESGLECRPVEPWSTVQVEPFSLTALPAVDGLGDPQVSWLVEASGRKVLHLGDTMFHGYWWRMALRHGPFDLALVPINGAVVDFPHRRPASPLAAALDPEQAALVGELVGARIVVPIHYAGYRLELHYRPVADAGERFLRAAAGRPYEARLLRPGEAVSPAPSPATARSP
jgi:L-ascorbate metabolism protein UlaG (beta-lactamase superfamily)